MHQIKHRRTGAVLFESDATSLKAAVECAAGRGISLAEADLPGADLRYAQLRGVDLYKANLDRAQLGYANISEANLNGASLEQADLLGAALESTDLRYANLHRSILEHCSGSKATFLGANLAHASLDYSHLHRADFRHSHIDVATFRHAKLPSSRFEDCDGFWPCFGGASLENITFRFDYHFLVGRVLRRHAGESRARREAAGLVLVSLDWCWEDFLKFRKKKAFAWVMETLAGYMTSDYTQPAGFLEALEWSREERRKAYPALPLPTPTPEARPA